MKHAIVITACLWGAGAQALAPPWAVCDNADGTLSEFMSDFGADDANFAGMTSFEVTEDRDGGRIVTEVIVACETREALSFPQVQDAAETDKINDIFDTKQRITLRQLARRLNRIGVDAKYGTLEAGNCACNPETYRSSF